MHRINPILIMDIKIHDLYTLILAQEKGAGVSDSHMWNRCHAQVLSVTQRGSAVTAHLN